MNSNFDKKIQELNFLEQNFQSLLMQKQAFQMELSETESAIEEIESSGEEIYKIIGQIMIKSDRKKIKDELENKKRLFNLRIKSIEKQENNLTKKIESLRQEILEKENNIK